MLTTPLEPSVALAPPRRHLFTTTDDPGVIEMEIDNTSLEHFTTCARSAQYRLVASREGTRNTDARNYGLAKHKYLECRLRGGTVEEAEAQLVAFFDENPVDSITSWRTLTHAIDSMRAYEAFWHSMPIVPIVHNERQLVEIPFRIPLCDVPVTNLDLSSEVVTGWDVSQTQLFSGIVRVLWTGRIDAIAPFLNTNYVWDHKTTSMVGPSFYDEFHLSSQMQGYVWAAGHLFPELEIRGARINIIVGRAPSKTGVAHAFERQTYVYPDSLLAEWHRDTQLLVADFIGHLLRNAFPKMTKWCQGKYGQCQYFPVCTAQPNVRHIVLGSDNYQDVTWSPLHSR